MDVDEIDEILNALAYAAPVATPSPQAAKRLMQRVQRSPEWVLKRADEGKWRKSPIPGISVRVLYRDLDRKTATMLVRMDPGTRYPRHRHFADEECYVVSGDIHYEDGRVLREGDYQRSCEHSVHDVQYTVNGCTIFLIASLEDELLPA